MHVHLVLPGLLWPGALSPDPTAGLALPALNRLLGFARSRPATPCSAEHWLLDTFQLSTETALAPLRLAGEHRSTAFPADEAQYVLCADPGHLRFAREHMVLADARSLDIRADEADAVISSLNTEFSELGHFAAPHPERWYLRCAHPVQARFTPLATAVGRPLAQFMDADQEARQWQRVLSEIQIMLHQHPVNQAREAEGRPVINTLWWWGSGQAPELARCAASELISDAALARGLARHADLPIHVPHPGLLASLPREAAPLIYLDDLLWPALHLDLNAWCAALARLEQDWFASLLTGLRNGRLQHVRISAPSELGTLEFELTPRALWRFWRSPRTLRACYPPLSDTAS